MRRRFEAWRLEARCLMERLRRVAAWAPLVWRDSDCDWADLLAIMAFKLDRMAQAQECDAVRAEDWEARQTEIRRAAALCRTIAADRYAEDHNGDNLFLRDFDNLARLMRRRLRWWWT